MQQRDVAGGHVEELRVELAPHFEAAHVGTERGGAAARGQPEGVAPVDGLAAATAHVGAAARGEHGGAARAQHGGAVPARKVAREADVHAAFQSARRVERRGGQLGVEYIAERAEGERGAPLREEVELRLMERGQG